MPTNGKTIIKDAVALCSYLSDYGVDQGNAIASTHSYTFDEKTPWDVIREVADACQTSGGAVGFDGYVDPPGNLWIFPRNSSNSTVDLTNKILRYKIDYDTYRVKNKIKVYGAMGRSLPTDQDAWTENSASSWVAIQGTVSDSTITDPLPKKGNKELKFAVNEATPHISEAYYPLASALFIFKSYTKISFWKNINRPDATSFQIRLYTDVSNYYAKELACNEAEWTFEEISCGAQSEGTSQSWIKVGNPSWGNITKVGFYLSDPNGGVYYIDNLFFSNIPYEYTASDTNSQALYGVRMPEPIVDDSLQSDDECTKKAQSLLAYYKDRVTTLTLTTFGDNNFKPGDKLHVVLSNDNIDDYFRILEVRHTLQDVLWQTELLMSNEPIMIDYVFRKMFEVQKNLATNQRS
jgi:hypothetical protein